MSRDTKGIEALLATLSKGGDLEAWAAKFAPHGTLEPLWQECTSPVMLLELYARTGDRKGLARALVECIRTVLSHVPADEPGPGRALTAVEQWIAGAASLEDVERASLEARAAADRFSALAPGDARRDLDAAYAVAEAASALVNALEEGAEADDRGSYAAMNVSFALAAVHGEDSITRTSASVAAMLRSHLTCPAFEQLRDE